MKSKLILALAVLVPLADIPRTFAQTTAFNYQGRLKDANGPANGIYDLRFGIHDAEKAGVQQGITLTNNLTSVSNGLFSVTLDFGNQFTGANRWLEIGVRSNGSGVFVALEPRQPLTSVPYAIYSANSANANSASSIVAANITGSLAVTQLPGVVVTNGASSLTLSGRFIGNGIALTNVDLRNVYSSGAIQWGNSPLTFATASTIAAGNAPHGLAVNDLNGDGRPDLACANSGDNTVTVLTNNGSGQYAAATTNSVGNNPSGVTAVDINGDDKVDLISANADAGTLTVLTNDGQGHFNFATTLTVGLVPHAVLATDVNKDGAVDLISANAGENTLTVMTNNGWGGFAEAAKPGVGNQPYAIVAADVNEDGWMDLISANFADSTLTVLTNNTQCGFTFAASSSVGSHPYSIATADLNGDGRVDVVSADASANTLTVLTNHGHSGFTWAATVSTGITPIAVAATDVNRDGWIDLISANNHDNTLSVFTNDHGHSWGIAITNAVGTGPWALVGADLNGDGRMDLASANASANSLSIVLNAQLSPPATFIGNGAGLTNVSAAGLSGLVASGNIDDGGSAVYEEFLASAKSLTTTEPLSLATLASVGSIGGPSPSFSFLLDGSTFGTVIGFMGHEAISDPYEFVVQTLTPDPGPNPEAQLGRQGKLIFSRNGRTTSFAGVITACSVAARDNATVTCDFRISSPLTYLALSSDYRIRQKLSVPELVTAVYSAGTSNTLNQSLFATYAKRESAVQYQETSLNFISRLLEDEGIFYFFSANGSPPQLTLGDDTGAYLPVLNSPFTYHGDQATNFLSGTESIRTFQIAHQNSSKTATLKSYDFTKLNTTLQASFSGPSGQGEIYQFGVSAPDSTSLALMAHRRQERSMVERNTTQGTSVAPDLRPGYTFTLDDRTSAGLGGSYLVTAIRHAAFRRLTNGITCWYYGNQFEVIPASLVYRPALKTPKPTVPPCTAIVTGPAGEEIFTDQYGRVKVQFHWDRHGTNDDNSSTWIRVASQWAAKNYGAVFTPRVGQEVLVNFINGDPDQPVIIGSLYNAENMPPYALPDNATQSGIQTRSSKGGAYGNGNAIRFEDKKGSEELWLHAEKNMLVEAEQDASFRAGNRLMLSADAGTVISSKTNIAYALSISGAATATAFVSSSDRNAKENFQPVNAQEVLNKVAALPMSRWNYKQDITGQHIGPMAQDFHAAFRVGPDDKHIATVDADGVALAAIQGLNQKLESGKQKADTQMEKLEVENEKLKQELSEIKKLLKKHLRPRSEK